MISVEKFRPIAYYINYMDIVRLRAKKWFNGHRGLFVALGDPYRQQILLLMAEKDEISVGEIAKLIKLSRPTVSHHIKVLRLAGLLGVRCRGVRRYYYPTFKDHIKTIRELITLLEELEKTCERKEK